MKFKRKFLLGIPLALLSLQAYFGIVCGYLFGNFFSGKRPGKQGIIKSIIFRVGKYKLHLHHWLICLGVFVLGVFVRFFPFSYLFPFGFLGGLIFQGIFSYPDWYRILMRVG